jgi:poly(3-hydroxybutyrate) depolymerase
MHTILHTIFRTSATAFVVLGLIASATGAEKSKALPKKVKAEEIERLTVTIVSTKDHTPQKALFSCPPDALSDRPREAVPLLVQLHTWSGNYKQCAAGIPDIVKRGWAVVAPDFRGVNSRPEACASELAIQDVLDAVDYAQRHARIDATRIYLLGASGGGHMSLMMAAKAPQLWAGVSAWVPVTDLVGWYAKHSQQTPPTNYARMLEQVCGGPCTPATEAEYRARSPLFHVAAAKGVTIDINAGIHDGHTGSVPVDHTLRAFNSLAVTNGLPEKQVPDSAIESICREEKIPSLLAGDREDDPERSKQVLFRRVAGPVRVTIFEGGHDIETEAALAWLSRQRKGTPADFTLSGKARSPFRSESQAVPK